MKCWRPRSSGPWPAPSEASWSCGGRSPAQRVRGERAGEHGEQHGRRRPAGRSRRPGPPGCAPDARWRGGSSSRCTRAVTAPPVTASAAAGTAWPVPIVSSAASSVRRPLRRAATSSALISASRATSRRSAGEDRHGREAGGQAAGQGEHQMMTTGQVRPFVREDGCQLRRVQHGERPAGQHDRGRAAGHAVSGRTRVIEHDRRVTPRVGSRATGARRSARPARARGSAGASAAPGARTATPPPRAAEAASTAAKLTPSSNAALRYTAASQTWPVTDRQTASASPGQPAIAALTRNSTAASALISTLAIAASQAASPSRALSPPSGQPAQQDRHPPGDHTRVGQYQQRGAALIRSSGRPVPDPPAPDQPALDQPALDQPGAAGPSEAPRTPDRRSGRRNGSAPPRCLPRRPAPRP